MLLIFVLSCPQFNPRVLVNHQVLVTREDKEISTKELRNDHLEENVRGQFDEWINIKGGGNDRVFDLLFLVMVEETYHYFGLSFVRFPFVRANPPQYLHY